MLYFINHECVSFKYSIISVINNISLKSLTRESVQGNILTHTIIIPIVYI